MTRYKNPRVAVLLATFNGSKYLVEQINTILHQSFVDIRIFVSDDLSTDGTNEIVSNITSDRIEMLPKALYKFGSANKNFMRLIKDAPEGFDYYAFSDQDDIWFQEKLSNAVSKIRRGGFDAYSSNVIAFWPSGKELLIDKAQPIAEYDYLFEAAGPGCTYVIVRERFAELQAFVRKKYLDLQTLKVHDWAIYAYARSKSWSWFIDPTPGMKYRQHDSNELGANSGLSAVLSRLKELISGHYLQDVVHNVIVLDIKNQIAERLLRMDRVDALYLAIKSKMMRRKYVESLVLKILFIFNFFGIGVKNF